MMMSPTQANFREVKSAFDAWCDGAMLIGWTADFDVAMLRRECEIAGVELDAAALFGCARIGDGGRADLAGFFVGHARRLAWH